jgi:hypothetical protein
MFSTFASSHINNLSNLIDTTNFIDIISIVLVPIFIEYYYYTTWFLLASTDTTTITTSQAKASFAFS